MIKQVQTYLTFVLCALLFAGCRDSSTGKHKHMPLSPPKQSAPKQAPKPDRTQAQKESDARRAEFERRSKEIDEAQAEFERRSKEIDEAIKEGQHGAGGGVPVDNDAAFRFKPSTFRLPDDSRMEMLYGPSRQVRHWVPVEYRKVVKDKFDEFLEILEVAHPDHPWTDVVWAPRVSAVMVARKTYASIVEYQGGKVLLMCWPPNVKTDQTEWVSQTVRDKPYALGVAPPDMPGSGWNYDVRGMKLYDDEVMSLHLSPIGTRWWISDARWEVDPDWWKARMQLHDTLPNLMGPKVWTDISNYKRWDIYAFPRFQLYYASSGVWAAGSTKYFALQIFYAQPPLVEQAAADAYDENLIRHESAHAHGWGVLDPRGGHPPDCKTCLAGRLDGR